MSTTTENPFVRRMLEDEDESGVALTVHKQPVGSIERPITDGEIEMLWRLADGLAKSGFFKDARQSTQAFAKLIFGRDLGLSATHAMTDIHIVEGKPEMSANLQAAKIRSSARYEYEVNKLDDAGCTISFYEGEKLLGTESFGAGDAERAKLAGKDVYQRYPRNMFFARCMSNGTAFFCPDVTNGIRVYAEGEIDRAVGLVADRPPAPGQDAEQPADAVVLLTDEERDALRASIEAVGKDPDMLLAAAGVLSWEMITSEDRLAISQKLVEGLGSSS